MIQKTSCWYTIIFINLWIIAATTTTSGFSNHPYKPFVTMMEATPTPQEPPAAGRTADLKIRVYPMVDRNCKKPLPKEDQEPKTTVTIPGMVLTIASKLIPASATNAMKENGVDMEEIVRLSKNPEARGTLMEVEDHEKNERVVIGLE